MSTDPGAPLGAPAPPPVVIQMPPQKPGSDTAFAWALLGAFVAGMGVLAFHAVPKEQLTIYSGMLGAVAGSGVTKFIEWTWGAMKDRQNPGPGGAL